MRNYFVCIWFKPDYLTKEDEILEIAKKYSSSMKDDPRRKMSSIKEKNYFGDLAISFENIEEMIQFAREAVSLDYIIKAEAGVLAKKHGKTYYKNPFCFGEA